MSIRYDKNVHIIVIMYNNIKGKAQKCRNSQWLNTRLYQNVLVETLRKYANVSMSFGHLAYFFLALLDSDKPLR